MGFNCESDVEGGSTAIAKSHSADVMKGATVLHSHTMGMRNEGGSGEGPFLGNAERRNGEVRGGIRVR